MRKISEIDERLQGFIESQHMFFVATAPSGPEGHINVSPKGLEALRVLGPSTIAYVDHNGSGVETIAHLRENGRIVIMMCAFAGSPRIVRLHGHGEAIEPQDAEFAGLLEKLGGSHPARSIIRVHVERISDSCGFAVPLFQFQEQRTQLTKWAAGKGDSGLLGYQRAKNAKSIDGLPGLRRVVDP